MSNLPKHIYDESNGLYYMLHGDYYLPDIDLGPQETRPIGRWGSMRKDYLEFEKRILFNRLLLTGKLFTHLADVNEEATALYDSIVAEQKLKYRIGIDPIEDSYCTERQIREIEYFAAQRVYNEVVRK